LADTTFVDETSTVPGTLIEASWLNAINDFFYTLLAGATTAGDARTALGLGTIATQAANSVNLTGGTITGITDLTIADGGTGSSTAPAARLALGAYGNLLSVQNFTTNDTWTKPANCKWVIIEAVGAGGGGGGAAGNSTDSACAGSGASGFYGRTTLVDVTSIASSTITVSNTGGSAGAAAAGNGGTGGNTVWSDGTNTFTWAGGSGGAGITAGNFTSFGIGAAGGAVGTGLIGFSNPGAGLMRQPSTGSNTCRGGYGASSGLGIGGAPGFDSAGSAATGYGAGGGPGQANGSTAAAGKAGAAGSPGYMRVWEFY